MRIIRHIYVNGRRIEGIGVLFTDDLEDVRKRIASTYQVSINDVRFIYDEE